MKVDDYACDMFFFFSVISIFFVLRDCVRMREGEREVVRVVLKLS